MAATVTCEDVTVEHGTPDRYDGKEQINIYYMQNYVYLDIYIPL